MLLTRTNLIVKIEQDGRAVQVRVTGAGVRRRGPAGPRRGRAGAAAGDRPDDGSLERLGRSGPSARAGSVGEERELLMVLALNAAKLASQREIAFAYWGLEEVAKHWDTSHWMRATG